MTKLKTNNERLVDLIDDWGLHRRDVGRLLYKAILESGVCPAVDKWLKQPDRDNFRHMGAADLRLLELELALMEEGHSQSRDIEFEYAPDRKVILEKARAARKKS